MGNALGAVSEKALTLGRLLSEGVDLTDAADVLGVTVSHAVKLSRTSNCRAVLSDHRRTQLDRLTVRGIASAHRAMEVLLELAEDPAIPPRVRREAASDLLDRFVPSSSVDVAGAAAAGASVGALLAQMSVVQGGSASAVRVGPLHHEEE